MCVYMCIIHTHTHIYKRYHQSSFTWLLGDLTLTSILQELSLKETPVRAEHRKGSAQFREGILYQLHL